MWIAIVVPIMVLAIAIAVAPVFLGSFRAHRSEREEHRRLAERPARRSRTLLRYRPRRVGRVSALCPVCGRTIEEATDRRLVEAVERHSANEHGVHPEPELVETAQVERTTLWQTDTAR